MPDGPLKKWCAMHHDEMLCIQFRAALQDPVVLWSILNPAIKQFTHVLPKGHFDPFWAQDLITQRGTNMFGQVLGEARI